MRLRFLESLKTNAASTSSRRRSSGTYPRSCSTLTRKSGENGHENWLGRPCAILRDYARFGVKLRETA